MQNVSVLKEVLALYKHCALKDEQHFVHDGDGNYLNTAKAPVQLETVLRIRGLHGGEDSYYPLRRI
jgi:hypothetical protein